MKKVLTGEVENIKIDMKLKALNGVNWCFKTSPIRFCIWERNYSRILQESDSSIQFVKILNSFFLATNDFSVSSKIEWNDLINIKWTNYIEDEKVLTGEVENIQMNMK